MPAIRTWQLLLILCCACAGAVLAVLLSLERPLIATGLFGVLGFLGGLAVGAAAIVNPTELVLGLIRIIAKAAP